MAVEVADFYRLEAPLVILGADQTVRTVELEPHCAARSHPLDGEEVYLQVRHIVQPWTKVVVNCLSGRFLHKQ